MRGGGAPGARPGAAAALARGYAEGSAHGVAEVYDAYADGLFAYCRMLTGDGRTAAEILHDTVLIVRARADLLDGDAQLRALLYAVARSECMHRGGDHRSSALPQPAAQSCQVRRPGVVVLGFAVRDRDRLLPLIPVALAGVAAAEREALELVVRHGLDEAEAARVLDVSQRRVARLVDGARDQFATCLRVHSVCVHPEQECAELAVLLPGGVASGAAVPEPVDPALRVPAGLHVDSCPSCAPFVPAELAPEADQAGQSGRAVFAATVDALVSTGPPRPAPLSVRAELLRGTGPRAHRDAGHVLGRAVPAQRDGFPRTRRRRFL